MRTIHVSGKREDTGASRAWADRIMAEDSNSSVTHLPRAGAFMQRLKVVPEALLVRAGRVCTDQQQSALWHLCTRPCSCGAFPL